VIVTFQHLRTVPYFSTNPGFCRDSSKAWARAHGLNFKEFVRHGIEAEKLEAIGDAFALALVRWARECESRKAVSATEQAHG
jgi:hypothetical protein